MAKELKPCTCNTKFAYRVTAEDIPEADPNGFPEYDVYEPCGAMTRRSFAPGHDAKLKGLLIKLNREGQSFNVAGEGFLTHVEPSTLAAELGWSHFLTPAKPKSARKAKAKNRTGQTGQVKVGRWFYPATVLEDNGATLDVIYTKKDNTEVLDTVPAERFETK